MYGSTFDLGKGTLGMANATRRRGGLGTGNTSNKEQGKVWGMCVLHKGWNLHIRTPSMAHGPSRSPKRNHDRAASINRLGCELTLGTDWW